MMVLLIIVNRVEQDIISIINHNVFLAVQMDFMGIQQTIYA